MSSVLQSDNLPKPIKGTVFYEDKYTYACLASYPIVHGHCVVVWKDDISDLHLLSKVNYKNLMETVEKVRNALLKTMNTDKVYLLYMDEIQHVHWHLIPRTNSETGFTLLEHKPNKLINISFAKKLKKAF